MARSKKQSRRRQSRRRQTRRRQSGGGWGFTTSAFQAGGVPYADRAPQDGCPYVLKGGACGSCFSQSGGGCGCNLRQGGGGYLTHVDNNDFVKMASYSAAPCPQRGGFAEPVINSYSAGYDALGGSFNNGSSAFAENVPYTKACVGGSRKQGRR